MQVYVDEMPKNCIKCPFCSDIKVNGGMGRLLFCRANKNKSIKNEEKDYNRCLVKNMFSPLSAHDKQVRADERKKVCEEIQKELDADFRIAEDYFKISRILKNIEKGENDGSVDN